MELQDADGCNSPLAQSSLTLKNDRTQTDKLLFALDVHVEVTEVSQEHSLASPSSTQTCAHEHIKGKA